jgi:ribonuclease HII
MLQRIRRAVAIAPVTAVDAVTGTKRGRGRPRLSVTALSTTSIASATNPNNKRVLGRPRSVATTRTVPAAAAAPVPVSEATLTAAQPRSKRPATVASVAGPAASPASSTGASGSTANKRRKTSASATVTASPASWDAQAAALSRADVMRATELALMDAGYSVVCGVDEAGRGPLAGPVVAACCHVPEDVYFPGITDSKQIDETERERLYELLVAHPRVQWAVHVNPHTRIDEINILQATLESMKHTIEHVQPSPSYVLVDGNKLPKNLTMEARAVVKGDATVYCISAASILAKACMFLW